MQPSLFRVSYEHEPIDTCALILNADAVTGPEASVFEKAETLIAALPTFWPHSTNLTYISNTFQDTRDMRVGAFFYPAKSATFVSLLEAKKRHPGQPFKKISLPGLSFFTNSEQRAPRFDENFAPIFWDSVAIAVLMGAARVSGPIPYDFSKTTWPLPFLFLASACAHTLRPWIESCRVSLDGKSARPFAQSATLENVAKGVFNLLHQRGVHDALRQGVFAPNTHHSATHLVPGPFFDDAIAHLPSELVAAGEALWPLLPHTLWTQSPFAIMTRHPTTDILSAHEQLSLYAVQQCLDGALADLAPSFARSKRKTAR